jgi:act minimal PKS acyl carrier protein
MRQFTLGDLIRLLRTSGGADEHVDLTGDILDALYSDLGYDSLAILEMSSHIQREFGAVLLDDEVADLKTPRQTIELVNSRSAQQA